MTDDPTRFEGAAPIFCVEDLDGNVLRLGSEPREGEPLGAWRDMRGNLWMPQSGGDGWSRVEQA